MTSTRWSYGPDGLRERPVATWSDSRLLPRWSDLQPLLIRSAGVVGIIATIVAVASSDMLELGGEEPKVVAAVDPATASTTIAPAPELQVEALAPVSEAPVSDPDVAVASTAAECAIRTGDSARTGDLTRTGRRAAADCGRVGAG